MIGKFIVLNTIGAGLLLAAYLLGWLPVFWQADKYYAIPIIGGLMVAGLTLMCLNRISAAVWLADKLPVVGLAFTVIGLLWASQGVLEGDAFKRDVMHSLIGNLMGVVSYAWLELNVKVVGQTLPHD